MTTLELAQLYLQGKITLDNMFLKLHTQDMRGNSDLHSAEARRLISEASAGNWTAEATQAAFRKFVIVSKTSEPVS